MRRYLALIMVLLVLSAGCADFLPWSQSHSPLPPDDTHKEYPPGTNSEWIVASDQLLAAHQTALTQSAYRLKARLRSPGTTRAKWSNSTLTTHQGDGRLKIQETGDILALNGTDSYTGYRLNNTAISRRMTSSGKKYSYNRERRSSFLRVNRRIVTQQIQTILASGNFLANGTQRRNGTILYQYNVSGHSSASSIRSIRATVLIDPTGMIHTLRGNLTTNSNRPAHVQFSYSFTRVAQPPSQPVWVNQVPHLRLSTTSAGVLRLDQIGGKAIPAGTEIHFSVANDSTYVSARESLPKRLTPGDSAYLAITNTTGAGSNLQGKGNITVNQPPESANTTVRAVPGSGWIRMNTKKWHAMVQNISVMTGKSSA